MTSADAYTKFILKINKLNTSTNPYVDKGRFVLIFNEQQNRWLEQQFSKRDFQALLSIQELMVDNLELTNGIVHNDGHVDYPLPDDYFDYVVSYTLATRGNCVGRVVRCWLIKPFDLNDKLRDAYTAPSFDYEETIVTIANNKIQVYVDDFTIDKFVFSYYRYAKPIDIIGYVKVDGTLSSNVDPELSDKFVDEIISRCAEEVMRNFTDAEGFALSKDRIKTEE